MNHFKHWKIALKNDSQWTSTGMTHPLPDSDALLTGYVTKRSVVMTGVTPHPWQNDEPPWSQRPRQGNRRARQGFGAKPHLNMKACARATFPRSTPPFPFANLSRTFCCARIRSCSTVHTEPAAGLTKNHRGPRGYARP